MLLFLILFIASGVFGQDMPVKNKWPFYFFGPYAPELSSEKLDYKNAEKFLCGNISSNCKLKPSDAKNTRQYLIKELRSNPSKESKVIGYFVHLVGTGSSFVSSSGNPVDPHWIVAPMIEESFLVDLKGNRVSLSKYTGYGEEAFKRLKSHTISSTYRVERVIPEPQSDELREYWLGFANPLKESSNFWFQHKTRVYDIKYSRISVGSEYPEDDERSFELIKELLKVPVTILKGIRYGENDKLIFSGSVPDFYISAYDGELLYLKIPYRSGPEFLDLFDIGKSNKESLSPAYQSLEMPCSSRSETYWRSVNAQKIYPSLIFKVKPERLLEGGSFKSIIELEGARDPITSDQDHLYPPHVFWYSKYQTLIKERYFMKDIPNEDFEDFAKRAFQKMKVKCLNKSKESKKKS